MNTRPSTFGLRLLFGALLATLCAPLCSAQGLVSDLTVQRTVTLQGEITPSQITADQNDYAPTGLSTAAKLRLSSDASRNITGLTAAAKGRLLIITNVGTHNIVLQDANTGSTAANRFAFGADYTLPPAGGVILSYDLTAARWTMVASRSIAAGYATPTTTEGDLIVRGSSADQRLAIGTNNYVLTVDTTASGKIKWAASAASGTVTNTGGNLTSNYVVLGAGTADSKVAAGFTTDGTSKLVLGVTGTSVGSIDFKNATSGTVNIAPPTGALGTVNLVTPAASGTLATKDDADTSAYLSTQNAQSGNYTLVLGDRLKTILMTSGSANALTVPPNSSVAFPVGTRIPGWSTGAGTTTITPGSGVTLNSRSSALTSAGQHAAWLLEKTATDTWEVTGDLVP